MIRADLHMHSTVSDGSFTIPELIARARQNGLDVIAITDHKKKCSFRKKCYLCNRLEAFI